MIAWNADTGKRIWRFNTAPIESSPLLVKNTLYFGAWDNKVYALNAKNGRKRWTFQADDQMNTSAAYWNNTIYMASYAGSVPTRSTPARARCAGRRSHAGLGGQNSSTPARPWLSAIYIGNSDGTMYVLQGQDRKAALGAALGSYHLFRRRRLEAARGRVGTYDGKFFALDAATGDVKWQKSMPSAVHSSPTVMDGLVYVSVCAAAARPPSGPSSTDPTARSRSTPERQDGVAQRRRQVRQPRGGRRRSDLPGRARAHVRARPAPQAPPAPAPGRRASRSPAAISAAIAAPVIGHTR